MSAKRAIIGVGNKLMGDEGVGVHAVEYLRNLIPPFPPLEKGEIPILDGGTGGMTLLHTLEEYDEVFLIDCADFGGDPGEVRTFKLDQVKLAEDSAQVSLHGSSLAGILAFAEKLGKKMPKITIIAVQPRTISPSLQLSKECVNALQMIEKELKGFI